MAEEQKSIGWVVGMLALVVAYFGWAFLAADYFQNDPTGDAGRANFWINSLTQIPKLPQVLGYAFRERLWIVGLVAVLEAGVLILAVVMKKVEKDLRR